MNYMRSWTFFEDLAYILRYSFSGFISFGTLFQNTSKRKGEFLLALPKKSVVRWRRWNDRDSIHRNHLLIMNEVSTMLSWPHIACDFSEFKFIISLTSKNIIIIQIASFRDIVPFVKKCHHKDVGYLLRMYINKNKVLKDE